MLKFVRSRPVLTVLAAGAALVILYGIYAATVHAPPEALAKVHFLDVPKPMPAVRFVDLAGKRHGLGEFRGRYVLVNLWASWCAPCVRELPALAKLSRAMPANRLVVVAIDVERAGSADARDFLAAHEASALAPYSQPDTAIIGTLRAPGLPFTVLIDPEGNQIARSAGAVEWDDPEAVEYLRKIVKSE